MDANAATAPTTTPTTTLTQIDARNLKLLLDVAASRGTWKASEMTQVGSIYDKVAAAAADTTATTDDQQPTTVA